MRKHFAHPFLIFSLAVGLQGLWRFVLEPLAQTGLGISLGNFLFVLLRVGVIFALPLLLAWGCGFVRFQALAATAFATFVESVGFPLLQLWMDLKSGMAAAQGLAPTGPGPAVLGLMTVYMFNLPVVLLFAFAGYELGRRLSPFQARRGPAIKEIQG